MWGENAEYVRKALDIPNVVILRVEDGACPDARPGARVTPCARGGPVCAPPLARACGPTRPTCSPPPPPTTRAPPPPPLCVAAEGVAASDTSGRAKDVVPLEPAVHAYAKGE